MAQKNGEALTDLMQSERFLHRFERIFSVAVPVLAVIAGLLTAGVLIAIVGASPLEAYKALFQGAFGSPYETATSLNRAIPLILAGLGVTVAFRCGLWNIGGEGQIYIGGMFASAVGIYLVGLPLWIHLPLALLGGFVGGALYGGFAGYLKAKHGINEIITTIMMNYIAIYLVGIMVKGPMQEPPGYFPQSPQIQPGAILPIIWEETRLHGGLILALALALLFYVVLWKTPFGYEIRTIGSNIGAARHAGMKVARVQITAMLISGGLAGLAGASEILGAQYRLRDFFLPNYGYDSIAVALLGQLNPIGVVISGILFGALRAGAGTMQRTIMLPSSMVFVVQGTVILFVVGTAILANLPKYLAKRREAAHGN
ncbi:MAG: ABC transporter permease [Anaerolineaceae bacterium]|nr:ABC transporter permease [Anaerolineaceae bacterium]